MSKIETYLKVGSHCQIENKIYFFNLSFNGVFYVDIDDFSIHFVHKFSSETVGAKMLSTNGILFYEDVIYFFPDHTNRIMKYNIMNQREEIIFIPDDNEESAGIGSAIRKKHEVFMFSNKSNKIYILDLQKQVVRVDGALSALFKQDCQYTNIISSSDNCALLGIYGSNELIEIDLIHKKIVWSETLKDDVQIYGICFDGNSYWILQTESTDIYELNRADHTLQIYTNKEVVWEDETSFFAVPYSDMIFLKDEILALNCCLKNMLRINKIKKTIEDPIMFPKGFRMVNSQFSGMGIVGQYTVLDDKVLIYPWRGNMLLIYDIVTRQISGKEFTITEEEVPYIEDVCWQFYRKRPLYKEHDDLVSLTQFIQMIKADSDRNQGLEQGDIGRSIYRKLSCDDDQTESER